MTSSIELELKTITNLFTNPDMVATSGDVVVWENLCTNPSFELEGSGNIPQIIGGTGNMTIGGSATLSRSTEWAEHGEYSLKISGGNANSTACYPAALNGAMARLQWTPGETYTVAATIRLEEPQEFPNFGAPFSARRITIGTRVAGVTDYNAFNSDQPPNEPGVYRLSITFTLPEDAEEAFIRLMNGSDATPVWWDSLVISPGTYIGGYFDEDTSFDPDLTPQPRPGGGSRLVGQGVPGLTVANGAVVQSTQWAKEGGYSLRLIKTQEGLTYGRAAVPSPPLGQKALVWRYQDKVLTPDHSRFGTFGFGTGVPLDPSNAAPNEPGEHLLTVIREQSANSTLYLGGYMADIGDSVWFDLLTVTDTEDYDGPPFSGSTEPFLYKGQTVYPKWDGVPDDSTSSFEYFEDLEAWERSVDWDSPGQRRFEAGVDRGMFYPPEGDGVPWNGLISVNLNPGEGQMESHYVDGIKFDLDVPPTDYSATVEAFTYPEQLDECMGSPTHDDLLSLNVHGQMSKPFSFAYRTLIGDGEGGVEKGYKLHLVYNAYATPTATPHGTLEQMSMASNFTWNVQTIPQKLPGYRSTSYLTIDSTKTNPIVMEALEQVLYGADGVPPELPPMAEIISYLETYR